MVHKSIIFWKLETVWRPTSMGSIGLLNTPKSLLILMREIRTHNTFYVRINYTQPVVHYWDRQCYVATEMDFIQIKRHRGKHEFLTFYLEHWPWSQVRPSCEYLCDKVHWLYPAGLFRFWSVTEFIIIYKVKPGYNFVYSFEVYIWLQ